MQRVPLRAALLLLGLSSPLTHASDSNPFVMNSQGEALKVLEARLLQLEERLNSSTAEDELEDDYPGLDATAFANGVSNSGANEQGLSNVVENDQVIGMVNGSCLVRRNWGTTVTIEVLSGTSRCQNLFPTPVETE